MLSSPTLHASVIATDRWAVIDGIEEITEVDQTFLDNATAQWQIGRAVPIPSVSGSGQASPGSV